MESIEKIWNNAKKKTTSYKEQKTEQVNRYLERIKDIPADEIVYIDETGINTCIYREYGYAPRGQKVYAKISGRKFQRTNIVSGKMGNKIIAPMQYNGTTNSALFEFWFENCLLSSVGKGQTIVMDNAAFHRKSELHYLAKKHQCKVIFLPPYSPELNPIEKLWACLKKYLKFNLSSFSSLNDAIYSFFKVK